ncbi:hypothetical protein C173_08291 [Paenibacillus sp. FSL R7-277]|nr:hypothetical protein C173_08291 [Paenibacillus sp. FSL R7-277]
MAKPFDWQGLTNHRREAEEGRYTAEPRFLPSQQQRFTKPPGVQRAGALGALPAGRVWEGKNQRFKN